MTQQGSHLNALTVDVSVSEGCVRATVVDCREQIVARFGELSDAQAEQLVRESWRVGLGALMNAHAQAEEAKLADVGHTLMTDFGQQLDAMVERQHQGMQTVLAQFFDPTDGKVTQRMQAFVDDQGVLAKLLHQFVGADNSVLAKSLARQVGETSPLFKKLSATDSEGVVQLLEAKVNQALDLNRHELTQALDPLAEGGAMHRFVTSLRTDIDAAAHDQNAQIHSTLKALDQNDEQSLISVMLRETRAAHDALRRAVNPQLPDSPLALVRKTLEDMLELRLGQHDERLKTMQEEQRQLLAGMQASVARIETRKAERANSARGGDEFEERVVEFLHRSVPAGLCTVEPTGHRTGSGRCKKGDALVRFSEQSIYAGCSVVVEAKRDKSYTVTEALDELEEAGRNRGTDVGLFIMAKASAGPTFPAFANYGRRLLVTWDPEDPISDGLLHGAIVASLALAQRKRTAADPGNLRALADVEQRLIKELKRLVTIDKSASAIRNHADKIVDEVRKGSKALDRVANKAKATLRALNIELHEDDLEMSQPIVAGAHAAVVADDINARGSEGSDSAAAE